MTDTLHATAAEVRQRAVASRDARPTNGGNAHEAAHLWDELGAALVSEDLLGQRDAALDLAAVLTRIADEGDPDHGAPLLRRCAR